MGNENLLIEQEIETLGGTDFASFETSLGCCAVYHFSQDQLDAARQSNTIPDALVKVAAGGFQRAIADGDPFVEEITEHAFGYAELDEGEKERTKELFLFILNGEIHGFACISSFSVPDEDNSIDVLHVEGLVLDRYLQGKGVGSEFVEKIIEQSPLNNNYNTVIYHTANKAMRDLFLKVGQLNNVLAIKLAQYVGSRQDSINNVETTAGEIVVERGRYGSGGLYGASLGGLLISGLKEEEGDAQIVAVVITPEVLN